MENKRQVGASPSRRPPLSSSSTSYTSLDHLFGPKEYPSSPPSSSSHESFGSIFPPPSTVLARGYPNSGAFMDSSRSQDPGNKFGTWNCGNSARAGQVFKGESNGATYKNRSSIYHTEPAEPCYLSSSVYYGGQENYSPRIRHPDSHHLLKKGGEDNACNGSNSDSASRGNWWKGSLYY